MQNRLFRESNKTPLYYEDSKRTVYRIKIRDSFLIEEAYNQEAGVIQHIQTFQYLKESGIWGYAFTQEWPVLGQTHQLSYTIPINNKDAPIEASEIGDIAKLSLSAYPQQALALSPRFYAFSTGTIKTALVAAPLGIRVNIPLSIELSDKWVTHFNLGSQRFRGLKRREEQALIPLDSTMEPVLSGLYLKTLTSCLKPYGILPESVLLYGTKTRDGTLIVNLGARYAINCDSGLQIVPELHFQLN